MELVDGQNLSEILDVRGCLPWAEALPICLQVCAALEHAHEKGVVHRDLKPSNILVTADGARVKVVDFGISKMVGEKRGWADITATDELIGSPFYMSPEQCSGEELDARSDIYSFGCVLYEMLSGNPPFVEKHPIKILLDHVNAKPQDICKSFPQLNIPSGLGAIVHKCLEKQSAQRYQSVAQLRQDLELVQAGRRPSIYAKNLQLRVLRAGISIASAAVLVWISACLIDFRKVQHKDEYNSSVSSKLEENVDQDEVSSKRDANQLLADQAEMQAAQKTHARGIIPNAAEIQQAAKKQQEAVERTVTMKSRVVLGTASNRMTKNFRAMC
jgi:serine/threonine protein kinase